MAKSIMEVKLSPPPHKVWEFIVDPDKLCRWRTDIIEMDVPNEDLGPGDTFDLKKREGDRTFVYNVTVLSIDKPKQIALEAKGPKVTVKLDYRLAPSGFGTQFVLEEEITPKGLLGWLADRFVLPRLLPATVEQMTKNLKAAVEGTRSAAAAKGADPIS